ncbi:MAG: hypothetical protein H0V37_01535 [Chloroflexia bacterium]|nr:hypothetical protein [Chloroflexia bacterium]
MKQQFPCPSMCAMPGWPGFAWTADDAVRLFRLLVRPVVIAIVIAAVAATLLLGGRSLAPFVIWDGMRNPAQIATLSADNANAEQKLRAEAELLLQSFDSPGPAPASKREHP